MGTILVVKLILMPPGVEQIEQHIVGTVTTWTMMSAKLIQSGNFPVGRILLSKLPEKSLFYPHFRVLVVL